MEGPEYSSSRLGIVACGALARELQSVLTQIPGVDAEVEYLPAGLHSTPSEIPAAVDAALTELSKVHDRLFVAYSDCGTAGALDSVLKRHDATRLDGAHCYAFFAGLDAFEEMHDAEPGTFYLTDYLARQFDTLVYRPLGLDRHPELREDYFGNYTRLMYLAQSKDAVLLAKAEDAARRLGLRLEVRQTGLEPFDQMIQDRLPLTTRELETS